MNVSIWIREVGRLTLFCLRERHEELLLSSVENALPWERRWTINSSKRCVRFRNSFGSYKKKIIYLGKRKIIDSINELMTNTKRKKI